MDIPIIFLIVMQPPAKFTVLTKKIIYEEKFHFINPGVRCIGSKRTKNREFIW